MATQGQKLLAAGPTLVIAETALAMAHFGGIGAIVGLAIGAAAYVAVDEVERMSGKNFYSSLDDSQGSELSGDQQPQKADPITEKRHSLAYRLFNGKSTREPLTMNENDVDTEPLDEQENEQAVFPPYPQNERLSLGYLAKVGKLARFDPHMDMLLGKGLIVAGVPGMGKSNIAALVLESAARCDMPAVMFDLKREFHTIVDVAPNAIRAGHESLQGSPPGYVVLSVENADEFAQFVMTGKHQAIIDLPSYGTLTEAAKVITAVLNSFLSWAKAQGEDNCIPCLMMLDEAQMFLPQNVQLSTLSAETINTLQAAFFQMCNMGRSLGYTVCFFTQSIANLQKWAIRNCQRKVVGIHVEKNDLDRCEEEVDGEIATREQIKTMPEGVGVVIGFTPTQQIIKFDKRVSRHVSNTPGVARLRKPLQEQRVIAPTQAPVQRSLSPTSTVAVAEPTRKLMEESEDEHDLRLVVEAFEEGNVSLGQLQASTGLGQNRVRVMKARAQFQGLIPKDK